MLKEWQRDFNFIQESDLIDPEERISVSVDVFSRLCILLARLFPNAEINCVIEDLEEQFNEKKLTFNFDFSYLAQLRLEKRETDFCVILPATFPEQVKADYLSEMQKIVHLASLVKDDFLKRPLDDRPLLELRANALESEFLHSVFGLAEKENEVKFSLVQKEIMKKFPKGVMSLPEPLRDDFPESFQWDFYKGNRQN